MPNLKPLIDAVEFVKSNPDKHDQSTDAFHNDARCITSYAATNAGQTDEDYYGCPNLSNLAITLDIPYTEVHNLYCTYGNEEAIEMAERLIAKYDTKENDVTDFAFEYAVVCDDTYLTDTFIKTFDNVDSAKIYAEGARDFSIARGYPNAGNAVRITKRPIVAIPPSVDIPF
jgi:hypothetical protein